MPEQKPLKTDPEDERVIDLWLQTKPSAATREAYARDVADFQNWAADKTLRDLQLDEILAYARKMEKDELAPRTRRRKIAAVKSLLTFAFKLGHLPIDVGRPAPLPKIKNDLAERILTEEELLKLVAAEPDQRNQVLIRMLWRAGQFPALPLSRGRAAGASPGLADRQSRGEARRAELEGFAALDAPRARVARDRARRVGPQSPGHAQPRKFANNHAVRPRQAGRVVF